MSVWSQTSNPSQERFSQEPPRTSRMVLAWTSLQAASGGEGTNEHFLMSASSTHTLPPTEAARSHPAIYRKHEKVKKRAYEQRILEVEHASFTSLVFASGGLAKEATTFYKNLASRLAQKKDNTYSSTMNWLRCLLSFSLLRSAIQCIRGARSSKGWVIAPPPPDPH